MAPIVYINGWPGTGKFTIAKELVKRLPKSKLIDNHLLIDPVDAVLDRASSSYKSLRKALRRPIFDIIAKDPELRSTVFVFTDSQSDSGPDQEVCREYEDLAISKNCPFFPVIITCSLEENIKRVTRAQRIEKGKTKLTSGATIIAIRKQANIFRFNCKLEIELDVTHMQPDEAASVIYEHICKTCRLI